ncbi:unnamed protein product [Cyclocybe aegerita]|uniref:BTB domain-containing protein n=1 Tax=Cyclocybe aegerita TaxID=1973307 RepID=A0A8S0WH01_CYCAE|nr:unnamed protein product [Cyclocybe aegerita]
MDDPERMASLGPLADNVDSILTMHCTHPDFGAADADIVIQSSDGVLFRLHRKDLETHTGAFPFIANPDEMTLLTEPSGVLEDLFKSIYPRRQPDLESIPPPPELRLLANFEMGTVNNAPAPFTVTVGSSWPAFKPLTPTSHAEFNAPDADITIQSSNLVLFRLHRKNLEMHTGGFPGGDLKMVQARPDEVISLSERSNVLELLFKFVYPRRQPSLKGLPFDTILALAEAVEKYEVYSAMRLCEVRLREFLPKEAARILDHAIKHDYPDLIEACVPALARQPLLDVLDKLPLKYARAWARYHEAWRQIFQSAIQRINEKYCGGNPNNCYSGGSDRCRTMASIAWILQLEKITSLSELKRNLHMEANDGTAEHHCNKCTCPRKWEAGTDQKRTEAATMIRDGIMALRPFNEFLKN